MFRYNTRRYIVDCCTLVFGVHFDVSMYYTSFGHFVLRDLRVRKTGGKLTVLLWANLAKSISSRKTFVEFSYISTFYKFFGMSSLN